VGAFAEQRHLLRELPEPSTILRQLGAQREDHRVINASAMSMLERCMKKAEPRGEWRSGPGSRGATRCPEVDAEVRESDFTSELEAGCVSLGLAAGRSC